MNPKAKGEISEGVILAALLKKGFSVSIPFGNNQRYDFIVDEGTRLLRVQCKTGRVVNGCIVFSVTSKNGFTGERRGYSKQADVFLVYCPQVDQVLWIPVDKSFRSEMRLRIDPLKKGAPLSTVKWARDFLL